MSHTEVQQEGGARDNQLKSSGIIKDLGSSDYLYLQPRSINLTHSLLPS